MPFLVCYDRKGRIQKHWPLRTGRTLIGSASDCAVSLPAAEGLAGEHARIDVARDGFAILTDLDAPGGTRVNDLPVRRIELREGDRILFGGATFFYSEGDVEAFERAATATKSLRPSGAAPGSADDSASWTAEEVGDAAAHAAEVEASIESLYSKLRCLSRVAQAAGAAAAEHPKDGESRAERFVRLLRESASGLELAGNVGRIAVWVLPRGGDAGSPGAWRCVGDIACAPIAPNAAGDPPGVPASLLPKVAGRGGAQRLRAGMGAGRPLEPGSGIGEYSPRSSDPSLPPVRAIAVPLWRNAVDPLHPPATEGGDGAGGPEPARVVLCFEAGPGSNFEFGSDDEEFLLAVARIVAGLANQCEVVESLRRQHRLEERKIGDRWVLVTANREMTALLAQVDRLAPSAAAVLLQGETGTGKELFARLIHQQSDRKSKAFVPVNCAALPEALLESELFGHVKGAFTGAIGNKRGFFEQADGGTLFLDEIGELSPEAQATLLRVLELGELRPVGGDEIRHVNVRVVAATHRDLWKLAAEEKFREDLIYRLTVATLRIPSLHERPEDIPQLLEYFLGRLRPSYPGSPLRRFSREAIERLQQHRWPGNVRELRNAVERALLAATGEVAGVEMCDRLVQWPGGGLASVAGAGGVKPAAAAAPASSPAPVPAPPPVVPAPISSVASAAPPSSPPSSEAREAPASSPSGSVATLGAGAPGSAAGGPPITLKDAEIDAIRRALAHCNGHKVNAAKQLGISRSTLYEKLKEYEGRI